MTGPCRMPGQQCPNQADVVVTLFLVGDRALCRDCVAVLERVGAAFTIKADGGAAQPVPGSDTPVIQPPSAGPLARRVAALRPEAPKPSWKPAWMERLTAKELGL